MSAVSPPFVDVPLHSESAATAPSRSPGEAQVPSRSSTEAAAGSHYQTAPLPHTSPASFAHAQQETSANALATATGASFSVRDSDIDSPRGPACWRWTGAPVVKAAKRIHIALTQPSPDAQVARAFGRARFVSTLYLAAFAVLALVLYAIYRRQACEARHLDWQCFVKRYDGHFNDLCAGVVAAFAAFATGPTLAHDYWAAPALAALISMFTFGAFGELPFMQNSLVSDSAFSPPALYVYLLAFALIGVGITYSAMRVASVYDLAISMCALLLVVGWYTLPAILAGSAEHATIHPHHYIIAAQVMLLLRSGRGCTHVPPQLWTREWLWDEVARVRSAAVWSVQAVRSCMIACRSLARRAREVLGLHTTGADGDGTRMTTRAASANFVLTPARSDQRKHDPALQSAGTPTRYDTLPSGTPAASPAVPRARSSSLPRVTMHVMHSSVHRVRRSSAADAAMLIASPHAQRYVLPVARGGEDQTRKLSQLAAWHRASSSHASSVSITSAASVEQAADREKAPVGTDESNDDAMFAFGECVMLCGRTDRIMYIMRAIMLGILLQGLAAYGAASVTQK